MKRLLLLSLSIYLIGCSTNEDFEDIIPPHLIVPEITQGVEIEITKEGDPFTIMMVVCDEWNDLSRYDFKSDIGGFFNQDSLSRVGSKEASFYRFELEPGEYLLHIGSGSNGPPPYFSLKEFKVEKDKVTKLSKNYTSKEMDFSDITDYQMFKGVYIPW